MKMNVRGFEINEGTSAQSGKPYSICNIHCEIPLAAAHKDGNVAKGFVTSAYEVDAALLRTVAHLEPPFVADLEVMDVQRYGKRQQMISSIRPIAVAADKRAA